MQARHSKLWGPGRRGRSVGVPLDVIEPHAFGRQQLLQGAGDLVGIVQEAEANDGAVPPYDLDREIDMAREHCPDLILMDIQLPDVSGLEVTKWLKNDEDLKSTPVIAITAFATAGHEEEFREGGCDAYIVKPISIPDFLQTVERLAKPLVAEWEPNPAECETIAAQAGN